MKHSPRRLEMITPPSDLDPLVRAKTYPYEIPRYSYLFRNGAFERHDDLSGYLDGRIPVIASGSNRSPAQLARKYHDFEEVTIPVERAQLKDYDVVYAAHITGYGSIAANLQHIPGASVEVSITWLGDDQLARMDATEGRGYSYDFTRLSGLTLTVDGRPDMTEAYAYAYRGGCLRHEGVHAGLREIVAEERPHAAFGQTEIQRHVRDRLAPGTDLDVFIRENLDDKALRVARETELQEDALPFTWPHVTIIS